MNYIMPCGHRAHAESRDAQRAKALGALREPIKFDENFFWSVALDWISEVGDTPVVWWFVVLSRAVHNKKNDGPIGAAAGARGSSSQIFPSAESPMGKEGFWSSVKRRQSHPHPAVSARCT